MNINFFFTCIIVVFSLQMKAQTYQKYEVQTATQPQYNPSPLLKKYDVPSPQPAVEPYVRYESPAPPASQETRVFGYYNISASVNTAKTMNLLIVTTINHLGLEEIKIKSYKKLGESYWITPSFPLSAQNISNNPEYSHITIIDGLEVYFKF